MRIELSDEEFVSLVVGLGQYLGAVANNPATQDIMKRAIADPAGSTVWGHIKTLVQLHARLVVMLQT